MISVIEDKKQQHITRLNDLLVGQVFQFEKTPQSEFSSDIYFMATKDMHFVSLLNGQSYLYTSPDRGEYRVEKKFLHAHEVSESEF